MLDLFLNKFVVFFLRNILGYISYYIYDFHVVTDKKSDQIFVK